VFATSRNTAATDVVLARFADGIPVDAADAITDASHSRSVRVNPDLPLRRLHIDAVAEREWADPLATEMDAAPTLLDSILPVIAEDIRQWSEY
jgi:hypothetical protein